MNKLLITREADLSSYQQWIRFDIRSDDFEYNRWACLKVKESNEMIPYQSFEVEKDMLIGNLCSVIDLLKSYLEQIQRDE